MRELRFCFGWVGGVECVNGGGPDSHKAPWVASGLRENEQADVSVDKYGSALDDKVRPDS